MDAYTILSHLNDIFHKMTCSERYEISKELFGCRMVEGTSVWKHGWTKRKQIKTVSSNAAYFHYGKPSHWRQNCKDYLAIVKFMHGDASTLGIFVIELFTTASTSSWVLDTGYGSHVCTDIQ